MNVWASIYPHHRWSNLMMIDFLSGSTDEQLAPNVPGTYGSSLDTIRHLISSDADYVRIIPDTPDLPQIGHDGPSEISVWAWRKSDEGQALLCQLGPMNREESPGG